MESFFSVKQQSSGISIEDTYAAINKLKISLEQVNKASSIKPDNSDIKEAIKYLDSTINGIEGAVNPQPTETNSTENAPTSFRL